MSLLVFSEHAGCRFSTNISEYVQKENFNFDYPYRANNNTYFMARQNYIIDLYV